ncbi:hypothetical protein [Mycobacterium sp. 050134]|uniref:hypothetical protein n=1 Tax=Mycobacterium sp. 050134 TaxID=3096111 RepID=UPI003FA53277
MPSTKGVSSNRCSDSRFQPASDKSSCQRIRKAFRDAATQVAAAQTLSRNSHRVASPINVTSVCDVDDPDDHAALENPIYDPELAAPSRIPALKLTAKGLTNPVGIFG